MLSSLFPSSPPQRRNLLPLLQYLSLCHDGHLSPSQVSTFRRIHTRGSKHEREIWSFHLLHGIEAEITLMRSDVGCVCLDGFGPQSRRRGGPLVKCVCTIMRRIRVMMPPYISIIHSISITIRVIPWGKRTSNAIIN